MSLLSRMFSDDYKRYNTFIIRENGDFLLVIILKVILVIYTKIYHKGSYGTNIYMIIKLKLKFLRTIN